MCVHVCLPHLLSSPFFSIFLFNFYLLESPPLLLSSLNEIPFPLFHPRHFTFIFSTKPWLLIGENAIFCVILQDFPVNDASDYMCLPTIHFHPPPHTSTRPSPPSFFTPILKGERLGGSRGNSRRIAAGTQLGGVLWRELKEWPVVLSSSSIVCLASLPLCPLSFSSLMANCNIPLFKQSQQGTCSAYEKINKRCFDRRKFHFSTNFRLDIV